MSFLLDTNAVSEWVKPRPDLGLVQWLDEADEDRLFLSHVTLGELRNGFERLLVSRRKARLDEWLREDLPARFESRMLPVDAAVADSWGHLLARAEAAGFTIDGIDCLIAATAEVHDLCVVTRNVAHFEPIGIPVCCPWTE